MSNAAVLRRVLVSVLVAPATLVAAPPAGADTYADFGVTPVTVSRTCFGTASAEAAVAPLQSGDLVEDGVRVVVRFSSARADTPCVLTATATWRNVNTGLSGMQELTVASSAHPSTGSRYGTAGYDRADFRTGSGTVEVAVSTQPHRALRVTV